MPYYDIHITGSGGTPQLRNLFENTFETQLEQNTGGDNRVTYSWGAGGELPGGLAKVLDIISGATPASGKGYPTTDESDLPPAKTNDERPPVQQEASDSGPNQSVPEQAQVNPATQGLANQSAPVQQASCPRGKLDVVV